MSDVSQWKVVLVDDEPDSLNLLSEMLTLHNAEVYRAQDAHHLGSAPHFPRCPLPDSLPTMAAHLLVLAGSRAIQHPPTSDASS